MIKEIPLSPYSGWLILPFQLIALPAIVLSLSVSISTVAGAKFNDPSGIPIGIAGIVICALLGFLWLFN